MSTESQAVDHYEAVLTDLRAKRDQIDQAIQVIEALRTGGPAPSAQKTPQPSHSDAAPAGPGAFLGMTVVDATKRLLETQRKALPTSEIVVALEAGGLVMNSVDKLNTVGSILTRRFNTHGDIVRVRRGIWGLQSWYGSRNFKAKAKAQDEQDGLGPVVPEPIHPDPIRHTPSPVTGNEEPDPWGPDVPTSIR